MLSLKKITLLLSTLVLGYSTSFATLIIFMEEVTDGLQFTASGSLNFSADQTEIGASDGADISEWANFAFVGDAGISSTSGGVDRTAWQSYDISWESFETVSGDVYGFDGDDMFVPVGYVAGTAISNVALAEDLSLSDWGLDENTSIDVTMSHAGGTATMTFTTSAVPEPSTYALIAGVVSLFFVARRRKLNK